MRIFLSPMSMLLLCTVEALRQIVAMMHQAAGVVVQLQSQAQSLPICKLCLGNWTHAIASCYRPAALTEKEERL
ncbi:hypothetical protein C8Q70DRAFT_973871 [Cubamyces menziesii]|nr:hypothetical protein C8Q70DRAFT_973871 [Cubamyces menziesii]